MKLRRRGLAANAREDFAPALITDDNRTLVFGADWAPLLGGRTDAAARKTATTLKASHYVVVSNNGQAGLGTVRLSRGDLKKIGKRKLYPAASAFAMFRPNGTAVGFFILDDGRIWVVLSQNGMVRRNGDLIYTDQDMAWQRLHQLQSEAQDPDRGGGAWTFYGNVDENNVEHLALEELLNVEIKPLELRRFSFDQLPKPVKVCLYLTAAFFAWQVASDWHAGYSREQKLAQLRANMQEPELAWARAVAEEASGRRIDHIKGVEKLYEELTRIPLELDGWRLHKAGCTPSAQRWLCAATYLRDAYGTTNNRFDAAVPKGWTASFDPMGTATGSWGFAIEGSTRGVNVGALPTREQILRKPVSQLQEILPAFTAIRLPSAEPWSIGTPTDGNGKAISRPSGLLVPASIPLILEGPLRSLSVWDVDVTPSSIRKVDIERIDVEASLNSSPLKMILIGEMYVQSAK
ncbi:type 4b pilus protein PilO2 [Achromobacter sp. DH1f]|uniref:type 4b pilus protein PilO2 n=1 Tax=Achromobacter sp. DH1f TaxID=1397275 RepID=UPI0004697921|nr:type 4b pilus protein PilO2 [Achromobacter sp. DH1f]